MEFVDDQSFYQDKFKQTIDEKAKWFYQKRNRPGQTRSFIDLFEEDIARNSKFISGNTPLT
jgi:hypothetical protein